MASFVLGCLALTCGACAPPPMRAPELAPVRMQPAGSELTIPAAQSGSTASGTDASVPMERANSPEVTTGPGWVPIHDSSTGGLAFAANGLWFASFVDTGIVLGDAQTGQPLAFAPFVFDKSNALAFHPSSRYLVAVADFTALVLAIQVRADGVRLRREADLPVAGHLGLVPPAFDTTGRYLALAESSGATLYDFGERQPLLHIYPDFSSDSWVMGFSADTLYFVEPTTSPCKCDDYGGSDATIVSFRLGARSARRLRVQGDMVGPLHFRQARVAAATGCWDARSGQRRARYRLDADSRLVGVYRLRARGATAGILMRGEDDTCELVMLNDDGRVRRLGVLPEMPLAFAVRPQDDIAMFWAVDQERTLWFVELTHGQSRSVKLPERLCVEEGQVVSDDRCLPSGAELARPSLTESPEFGAELPVITVPEDTTAGNIKKNTSQEGMVDGVLLRK